MADVRGASGVPPAAAFGLQQSASTPSTPIYVDLATGDLYVLIGGAVTKIVAAAGATGALWGA